IEAEVETIGDVFAELVDVGDVDRWSRQDGSACDRALRDRNRELARFIRDRVVLRQLEMQGLATLVAGFAVDDINTARVGAGHEAALFQNQTEQTVDVALACDRACNLDQLP